MTSTVSLPGKTQTLMCRKSVSRIVSQAAPLLASTVTLQKHVDLLKMDAKHFLNYTTLRQEPERRATSCTTLQKTTKRGGFSTVYSHTLFVVVASCTGRKSFHTGSRNGKKQPTVRVWNHGAYLFIA